MKDAPVGEKPETYYHFCPRCGAPLAVQRIEAQSRLVCTKGDFVFYQNPHAAVGALIVNDRREVLLVERKDEPMKGFWDVPGGFVDWGESPSEAIIRELSEELHVVFHPEKLVGAYHGWYDAGGLAVSCMVLHYAGSIDGTPHPDSDVSQVRWFPVNALPSNLAFEHIHSAIAEYQRLRVES